MLHYKQQTCHITSSKHATIQAADMLQYKRDLGGARRRKCQLQYFGYSAQFYTVYNEFLFSLAKAIAKCDH